MKKPSLRHDIESSDTPEDSSLNSLFLLTWIKELAPVNSKEVQKSIYFYFIDYAKAFDYVDHNKLW